MLVIAPPDQPDVAHRPLGGGQEGPLGDAPVRVFVGHELIHRIAGEVLAPLPELLRHQEHREALGDVEVPPAFHPVEQLGGPGPVQRDTIGGADGVVLAVRPVHVRRLSPHVHEHVAAVRQEPDELHVEVEHLRRGRLRLRQGEVLLGLRGEVVERLILLPGREERAGVAHRHPVEAVALDAVHLLPLPGAWLEHAQGREAHRDPPPARHRLQVRGVADALRRARRQLPLLHALCARSGRGQRQRQGEPGHSVGHGFAPFSSCVNGTRTKSRPAPISTPIHRDSGSGA